MPEIHERVATLEVQMRSVERQLDLLESDLGSSRDSGSIRGRLHVVETDRTAASAAQAALEAAKREREAAEQLREERGQRRWSRRSTILVVVVGLPTALPTIAGAWLTLAHQFLQ